MLAGARALTACKPAGLHGHWSMVCLLPALQYYSSVSSLLERILDLLLGFIQRTHQALAAVGVAAMTRLILAAGTQMDTETWMVVRWREGGVEGTRSSQNSAPLLTAAAANCSAVQPGS